MAVDYSPALLSCDSYFGDQFEYLSQLTLLYLHEMMAAV